MSEKIAILGAGESGTGAALLGKARGYDVWLSDAGTIKDKYRKELDDAGIAWEQGGHDEARILASSFVVKSPGIPEKAAIIQKIRAAGIPVWSEIEFGSWFVKGKIVAITGSNGKTTTTSLIYAMMQHAGLNVGLGGNIGHSFARLAIEDRHDWYVLEVSSFQLDDIGRFRPHIAVLMNITPDHLDRYGYEIRNYAASKFRIAENQQEDDHFIWCMEDPLTREHMPADLRAQQHGFALEKLPGAHAWMEQNTIYVQMDIETASSYDYTSMQLTGKHNACNTMAAAIVGKVLDLRKESIRESFADFTNIEHRLEKVSVVKGVEFINDSKATNVNSVWYALESIDRPIVWIAGGVDKGNDYSILVPLVEKKVKGIVALGTDNRKIHDAFGKKVNVVVNTTTMEDAVKMAYHLADKGDIVLLSPACASFDLFENYEDRGRQFKKHVREL